VVFLLALELIDTYKLLALRRVIRSVAVGCGVASGCYVVNTVIPNGHRLAADLGAIGSASY